MCEWTSVLFLIVLRAKSRRKWLVRNDLFSAGHITCPDEHIRNVDSVAMAAER